MSARDMRLRRASPARLAVFVTLCALSAACSGSGKPKPATVDSLLGAGIAAQQQGRLDAARQLFNQVLSKDPGNVYAHYDLGVIAQTQGNQQTALREYGAALVTNPKYVPALFNEATIWTATNPTLAMATYRQIVQMQPQAPTAYLNLGLLEERLGQHQAALHDLDTALHQDPALGKSVPPKLLAGVGRYDHKNSPSPSPSATSS